MSVIMGKVRKGKMVRLTFTGNARELVEVLGITQERITSNSITFPPDYVLVGEIMSHIGGVVLTPEVKQWYDDSLDFAATVSLSLRSEHPVQMDIDLRPYQRIGVNMGKTANRMILADECGLGKTLQAYGMCLDKSRILIVCPAYGIDHWMEEYKKTGGSHVIIPVVGDKTHKEMAVTEFLSLESNVIVVVSGSTISKATYHQLLTSKWDTVIVDEAHRISNRKNVLSKVIQAVSKNTDQLIFITGAPLQDRFSDCLWTMLNCIDPLRFSSYWAFYHKFIESYQDFYGRVPIKARNLTVLADILAPIYLRRTKDEVAPELPPLIESVIKVKLKPGHRAIYDKVLHSKLVDGMVLAQGVQLFGYLQRLVNSPALLGYEAYDCKTETVMELVKDILTNGEKVVIFGWHKEYLRQLHSALSKISIDMASEGKRLTSYKALYVDGDLSASLRGEVIRRFKQDAEVGVLIGTMGSIGELVNLQEASNVILVEGFWNPVVIYEAINRAHRINSTRPVNAYWIIAEDTIDQLIYDVCQHKEEFIDEANAVFNMTQRLKGEKSNGI